MEALAKELLMVLIFFAGYKTANIVQTIKIMMIFTRIKGLIQCIKD